MKHHRELLKTELSFHGHQVTHKQLAIEHEQLRTELQGMINVSSTQQGQCEDIRRRLDDLATMLAKTTQEINAMQKSLSQNGAIIMADMQLLAKQVDARLQSQLKGIYPIFYKDDLKTNYNQLQLTLSCARGSQPQSMPGTWRSLENVESVEPVSGSSVSTFSSNGWVCTKVVKITRWPQTPQGT